MAHLTVTENDMTSQPTKKQVHRRRKRSAARKKTEVSTKRGKTVVKGESPPEVRSPEVKQLDVSEVARSAVVAESGSDGANVKRTTVRATRTGRVEKRSKRTGGPGTAKRAGDTSPAKVPAVSVDSTPSTVPLSQRTTETEVAPAGATPALHGKDHEVAPSRRPRRRGRRAQRRSGREKPVVTARAGAEGLAGEGAAKPRATTAKASRAAGRGSSPRAPAETPVVSDRPKIDTTEETSASVGRPRDEPQPPRKKRTAVRAKPRSRSPRRRAAERPPAPTAAKEEPVRAVDMDAEAEFQDMPDEFSTDTLSGREMAINVSAGDECRIAVLEDGKLEELFIERASTQSLLGNIYKGRVTNVESSIQAVFVDFGLHKNGFLHISDVQPQYFPSHSGEHEDVGRKIPRHNRPPIQKCFRRGQEVIVQITKEGVGTKGPTLTTYLSIPGRFLVMMPGMTRHGVSRKIEDENDRREMRQMLNQLTLPSGMGFILRTAGLGRSKRELQRDLNYLLRLWKTVVARIKRFNAPTALYQESDLVTRTIRDVYTTDFKRVIVDDAETAKRAREFLRIAMPRAKPVLELYTEREPLFHRLRIEEEIERINMREVPLASGGSLVIDSTEALVAIDVNSGRFRSPEDAEETAFKINLEAAEEIARQLRLRDLGGLIVCDFIDMRSDRHKREVERALREGVKKHKERARTLRMSAFGLIEMTRQRQGPSLKRNIYYDCPHCTGSGLVKMPQSVILDVMRTIQLATHHEEVQRVTVTVAGDVAFDILNSKRPVLSQIEAETGKEIIVRGDASFPSDRITCICEDSRGRTVTIGRSNTISLANNDPRRADPPRKRP